MMNQNRFPNGKTKVFNVTYDDGVLQDVRFVALLNKYNLKGTFNLNSGLMENVFRMIAAHDDILPMTTIEIVEHLRSLR